MEFAVEVQKVLNFPPQLLLGPCPFTSISGTTRRPEPPCLAQRQFSTFLHAFRRTEMRNAMAYHLARECKLAGVTLHGFVVMPHHIHMVVKLTPTLTGPDFMRAFKANSAGAMRRMLTELEHREFDLQRGPGRRQFWKPSYRITLIEGMSMFWQKMEYTHRNPVKAGYVVRPEDYRWSSAPFLASGLWSQGVGLSYAEVMESLGTWRSAIQSSRNLAYRGIKRR